MFFLKTHSKDRKQKLILQLNYIHYKVITEIVSTTMDTHEKIPLQLLIKLYYFNRLITTIISKP